MESYEITYQSWGLIAGNVLLGTLGQVQVAVRDISNTYHQFENLEALGKIEGPATDWRTMNVVICSLVQVILVPLSHLYTHTPGSYLQ